MRIKHSAITSPFYEIAKVVEFDLLLGDDSWSIRIELFRNTESQGRFRCRIWQAELFRIQSTFPSEPRDPRSDELIWVEFSGPKIDRFDDFAAENPDAALEVVLASFKRFLEHTTLEAAE